LRAPSPTPLDLEQEQFIGRVYLAGKGEAVTYLASKRQKKSVPEDQDTAKKKTWSKKKAYLSTVAHAHSPATWEAEIRRIVVQGHPWGRKSFPDYISVNKPGMVVTPAT
jgi:hypothetical protein